MLSFQDPNLDPGWDWTTGEGCTLFYSPNGSVPVRLNNVRLPFFTPGDPLNLPGTRKDMYREDGWVLAYRDFGTDSDAPPLPFFVLYNRYRSLLRCMFYNGPSAPHTIYQAALKFRKGLAKVTAAAGDPFSTALLTFGSPPEQSFRTAYDGSQSLVQLSVMDVYRGWATFDFVCSGYDPDLARGKEDPALTLRITPVDESRIKLAGGGGLTLSQVLKDSAPTGAGTAGLQEAYDAAGSGYTTYRHASAAMASLAAWAEAHRENASWIGKAASAAALAAAGAGPVVPVVLGLAGAVLSYIGGSGAGGDLPVAMNFVGKSQFDFQGTIEMKDATTWCTNLYLREGPQMADGYRPVRNLPWGVFAIDRAPTLDVRTTASCIWDLGPHLPRGKRCRGIAKDSVLAAGAEAPTVQLNPECGLRLISEELLLTYGTARAPLPVVLETSPAPASHPFPVPGTFLAWEEVYHPPSGLTYVLTFRIQDPGVINASREIVYTKTVALAAQETITWHGPLPELGEN
jgi:hypothetical protein